MSTNFYVEADLTCNNPEHAETLHIGQAARGWKFLFHGVPEQGLTSWEAWQEYLATRTITDEYGRVMSLVTFAERVERDQQGDPSRCRFSGSNSVKGYHDPDGYDFYDREFS